MVKVFLNVYDLIPSESKSQTLSKDGLDILGLGVHHSGIEVLGMEISFGMDSSGRNDPTTDGIFIVEPRTACGVFKQQIELGDAPHISTTDDVERILNAMRPQWRAIAYHMLKKNCNCFSKEFAAAIDPKLAANIPDWVNRIGTAGGVVVPDALLKSLTEAVAPPAASAPELVGIISIPNSAGAVPTPLPPLSGAKEEKPASGGLLGFAKGVASAVATTVKSVVDDVDKKAFAAAFAGNASAELVAAFGCKVIHINRVQPAKLYVTSDGFGVAGSNNLATFVAWGDIASVQYGKVNHPPKDQCNVPPTFDLIKCSAKGEPSSPAEALLLFARDTKRIFPLWGFTSMGKVIEATKALTGAGVPAVTKAAIACDDEWRKKVRV